MSDQQIIDPLQLAGNVTELPMVAAMVAEQLLNTGSGKQIVETYLKARLIGEHYCEPLRRALEQDAASFIGEQGIGDCLTSMGGESLKVVVKGGKTTLVPFNEDEPTFAPHKAKIANAQATLKDLQAELKAEQDKVKKMFEPQIMAAEANVKAAELDLQAVLAYPENEVLVQAVSAPCQIAITFPKA